MVQLKRELTNQVPGGFERYGGVAFVPALDMGPNLVTLGYGNGGIASS